MTVIPPELLGLLSDDSEVRTALKSLALSSIAAAQDLMDNAIPGVKIQVIRSILPALTKALQAQDNKELDDIKETVASMYELIQAQIANTPS